MSSVSLLVGGRGSIGQAGHSSIQSFLGQSVCSFVGDRENDRTSWNHLGAVETSESLSCSFAGYQSAARGSRCGRLNDSVPSASGDARYSSVPKGTLLGSTLPSRSVGSSSRENCSSAPHLPSSMIVCPAATVHRGWEGATARILNLPSTSGRCAPLLKVHRGLGSVPKKLTRNDNYCPSLGQPKSARAMAMLPDEGKKADFRENADMPMMKDWNAATYVKSSRTESDPFWEQLNMVLRVLYAIAMYGGLVVAGSALCTFTGVDCWGGFKPSIETFVQALGWAIPPMMSLLLILEDEVVKVCPPARAIRDVEDEELMDFFVGMNPWQFVFVVAAGSMSEELFFRVAIQGGLAHALQFTAKGMNDTTIGVSALTTVVPLFAPFAQAFAAVLTASITGSMYYIISCPKDPTYVIAPVSVNKFGWNDRRDIKKRIAAWNERRQLKKIYSPLMEALLALYLGFEWVQTGNIFGPMITHTLYSLVVAGNGLRKIHDNRFKLRQRVSQVTQQQQQKELKPDVVYVDKKT